MGDLYTYMYTRIIVHIRRNSIITIFVYFCNILIYFGNNIHMINGYDLAVHVHFDIWFCPYTMNAYTEKLKNATVRAQTSVSTTRSLIKLVN